MITVAVVALFLASPAQVVHVRETALLRYASARTGGFIRVPATPNMDVVRAGGGTTSGGGGGGGGATFPYASLATFGTADAAVDSVAFNETAGCITFEGTAADVNELRVCGGGTGGDATLTLGAAANGDVTFLATAEFAFTGDVNVTGLLTSTLGALISAETAYTGGTGAANQGGYYPRIAVFTPDAPILTTGALSNSLHFKENADIGFDFNNGRAGTAAASDPAFIVHSRDQVTGEYTQITTENSVGMAQVENTRAGSYVGGLKSNITEASAQAVVRFAVPSAGMFGATVFYTVSDSDGTDHIARSGNIVVQGVNKAGTTTCTIAAARDTEAEDGSAVAQTAALTLTYTWTHVVSTSNCDLSINAASNAGANTLDITWNAQVMGSSAITVTPQ